MIAALLVASAGRPMEETDIKRKLATILVADIVGYSRLTANDEDWTIRALGDFRKVIDDIIARHDGRIFSTGGDSVLAEFASPVEAVRAAVDFQEASRSRNVLQPRDRQLRYRIGINLGDVMVRGSDLLGDGVNVAARLEGIAEPGGICVSASVWEHINGKLSIGYVDIGEQSVKNIPRPVRAYHLRVDGSVGEVIDAGAKPIPEAAAMPSAAGRQRTPIAAMLVAALGTALLIGAGIAAWQLWPKGHQASRPTAAAPSARPASQATAAAPQTAPAPANLIVISPASPPQSPPAPTPPTTTAQTPTSAPQPVPTPVPQPAPAQSSQPVANDRDQIILAVRLEAMAGVVEQAHRVGRCRDRGAEGIDQLIELAAFDVGFDRRLEAAVAQRAADIARISCRIGQLRAQDFIAVVADDERYPLLGVRGHRTEARHQSHASHHRCQQPKHASLSRTPD
jgi:adenylate cyclase